MAEGGAGGELVTPKLRRVVVAAGMACEGRVDIPRSSRGAVKLLLLLVFSFSPTVLLPLTLDTNESKERRELY